MNDEWIDNGNNTVSCPNCHSWFHLENAHYMYYCGHCGCKMKPTMIAENDNYGSVIATVKKKKWYNLKHWNIWKNENN